MLYNSFKRLILSSAEDNIKVGILSLKISVVMKEQTLSHHVCDDFSKMGE